MAKKIKVTVTKVSDVTSNGNFIHTLKTEGRKEQIFGTTIESRGLTYFVALKTAVPKDTSDVIDLDRFDVVERTAELEDQDGNLVNRTFRWLFPKQAQ